ncbi:MAG TPA: cyclic nucleotide-binding domain-containing protein [Jiangellaceae bacterium]
MVGLTFVSWAGLTIGQSSIDALLFARYGVDELPVLYLLLGLLLFLASLGVTAVLGRMARETLFVLMPLALALLLVAGRLAVGAGLELAYPGLWLFANLALLAQGLYLWGIAGLVTDTRQAKRLFPLFAAGGIAGAAFGGLVTGPLAGWLQPENLLLLWSGILVASAGLARAVLGRWGPRRGRLRHRRGRITTLAAVRDGWRTVQGSALLRWMSAGAVLFSVLLYSLYLPFSRAAVDRFPDAGELAGFLGAFSGVSTAVALLVSLVGANRLFARFGTPAVLLAYTFAYTLGFAVLAVNASFLVLVLVRFVQVVGMQGLANSAWEAMINVTPPERRDQARAFLNGVPTQAGTALAGVVLIVGQRSLQPRQLFLVGFGAAVLTAAAMWQARRSYAAAVADTLRAGRPHVFEDDQAEAFTEVREDAAAVSVAVAALSDNDPRVRRVAAEILGGVRNRELVTPLSASLGDPDAGVRAASVRALARLGDPSVLPGLSRRLADSDAAVRLAAVQAIRSFGGPVPTPFPLLDDRDPAVRAEAAAALLADDGRDRAADVLRELSSDEKPELRRIAVRALGHARGRAAAALVADRLGDSDSSVRAAAAGALSDVDPEHAVPLLVGTLSDPDSAVRATAAHALGRIGRPAVAAVAAALGRPETESGALLALELLPTDGHVDQVRRHADTLVKRALRDHRQAIRLAGATDALRRLLHDALARSAERHALDAVRAVAVVSDRSLLGEAIGNLRTTDPAQRAAAVELIDSSREASSLRPLLAIWDPSHAPPPSRADPVPELRSHADPWIRKCAEFAMTTYVQEKPMARTLPMLALIERVLLLRKVPMLEGLPPEDLERIAAVTEEHAYSDGDVVAAQGETGTETHIIVSGTVAVVANGREVARRGDGDVVGEMAVITGLPRSATLLAAGDVRLLTIGQRQFAGILRERPETAAAVMQVLARRLAERESPVM